MERAAIVMGLAALLAWGCAGGNNANVSLSPDKAAQKIGDLQKRVAKNPQDAKARFELARAEAALGKNDSALVLVDELLRDVPGFLPAYLLRARLLQQSGRTVDQLKTYRALMAFSDAEKYVAAVAKDIGVPYQIAPFELGPGDNLMLKFSPDGEKIVWQSNREGNWDIYLANADGSLPQVLTTNPADDEMPVFTADGEGVVFTSAREDLTPKARGEKNRELFLLRFTQRDPLRLTYNSADDWFPIALQDSATVIYVSEEGDNRPVRFVEKHSNLFRYRLADSSYEAITQDAWDNTSPAVAPDGRLLWVRIRNGNYEIVQEGSSAQKQNVLLADEHPKSGLSVAPNGARLAFFMKVGDNVDLYLMDLKTRNVQRLTADAAVDCYPVFSPDGKEIYFSSNRSGKYLIYRASLDRPVSREGLVAALDRLLKKESEKSSE